MDTITTVVLGCALMATAGFSITIKGDAIKSTMSDEANAMPSVVKTLIYSQSKRELILAWGERIW